MTYNNNTTKEKPRTLEGLKKLSLEIPQCGMMAYYPRQGNSMIHYPHNKSFRGKFCQSNGVVSFIDYDGRVFVCPSFNGILDCFQSNPVEQIEEGDFWVPFSTGSRPDKYSETSEYRKWNSLLELTYEWDWADTRAEIRERCPVGDVPEWILNSENCLEIPPEGIKVISPYSPKAYTLLPIWYKRHLDETFDDILPKLGAYNVHDGVLQINSNEGRSFVFKGFDDRFLKDLSKIGYFNQYFFVALSNKEVIIE